MTNRERLSQQMFFIDLFFSLRSINHFIVVYKSLKVFMLLNKDT